MATLVDNVVKALNNLYESNNKEWLSLSEIYEEVEKVSGEELQNGGASVRAALETHSIGSDAFKGPELFVMKEKGSIFYKSNIYSRIKFIKNMVKGDSFTRDQLMAIFKISGQSGIMPSNTLNCIVITTAENNGFYDDSAIENGTIQYTGAGITGDQMLTGPNKSLAKSKLEEKPVIF